MAERLTRLPYADQDAIRATWAELTNTEIDSTFRLIPRVYCDQGVNIRVGRGVFINHSCTLKDSVVAAGAVVTRDVPPGGVGGVPARVLRPVWPDEHASPAEP